MLLTTSQSSESGGYILHIAPTASAHYAAASSSPSNVIDLFDKATLRVVLTLPGHDGGTTALRSAVILGRSNLISSGKDGALKLWDDRSNNARAIQMTNPAHPRHGFLCCDVSPDGTTIAGGTELQAEDAFIAYWDPRQPSSPLRLHGSTHSDDITTLAFRPTTTGLGSDGRRRNAMMILSGSTDGLLSTSYPDEDDEDESTASVGNVGSSVSQAGWIPSSTGGTHGVWAATDMETFSTWTNDLDRLTLTDIRSPLKDAATATADFQWNSDYLITCKAHGTSSSSESSPSKLNIFTGTNSGDVALLSTSTTSAPWWCLHGMWRGGHEGVVRASFWDEDNQVLLTGGEDSKLNAWRIDVDATTTTTTTTGMDLDDLEEGDGDEMEIRDNTGPDGFEAERTGMEDEVEIASRKRARKGGQSGRFDDDDEKRTKKARRSS